MKINLFIMKLFLFILLVFISIQGFAQESTEAFKIQEIGIEVAGKDFAGLYKWKDAKNKCKELGKGWRLPTTKELKAISIELWASFN